METCLEALRSGESYELCLTTQLKKRAAVKPQAFYSLLRASNPAAHSAWLSFSDDLPKVSLAPFQISYDRIGCHACTTLCPLKALRLKLDRFVHYFPLQEHTGLGLPVFLADHVLNIVDLLLIPREVPEGVSRWGCGSKAHQGNCQTLRQSRA